jgi:uncharacterized membrane protein YbhN (UPF0104 family)
MPRSIHRRILPYALRLIGPVLFVVLLAWIVDPGDLVETLRDVDAGWAIATVAAFHVVILLRTLRWVVVHRLFALREESFFYHTRLSYATSLTAVTLPQFLSPFARFLMLTQDGQPRARAAGASLLEKASEFGAYVAFGVAGAAYFAVDHEAVRWALIAGTLGAGMALALAATLRARLHDAWLWLRGRFGEQAIAAIDDVADARKLSTIALIGAGALAVGGAQVAASFCATRAVGLDLSVPFVAAAWGLVALSMLLPISVNGIGTREGIYVATFASAGVTRDAAFAASLVVVAASVVASLPGVLEIAYRLMFLRADRYDQPQLDDLADVGAGAGPS